MSALGIAALVCVVFWSAYLIFGLVSCARGQGDLTWWVWPPLIFAFVPYLLRSRIGEARVDLIIVLLNGGLVLLVGGVALWTRLTEGRAADPGGDHV